MNIELWICEGLLFFFYCVFQIPVGIYEMNHASVPEIGIMIKLLCLWSSLTLECTYYSIVTHVCWWGRFFTCVVSQPHNNAAKFQIISCHVAMCHQDIKQLSCHPQTIRRRQSRHISNCVEEEKNRKFLTSSDDSPTPFLPCIWWR